MCKIYKRSLFFRKKISTSFYKSTFLTATFTDVRSLIVHHSEYFIQRCFCFFLIVLLQEEEKKLHGTEEIMKDAPPAEGSVPVTDLFFLFLETSKLVSRSHSSKGASSMILYGSNDWDHAFHWNVKRLLDFTFLYCMYCSTVACKIWFMPWCDRCTRWMVAYSRNCT